MFNLNRGLSVNHYETCYRDTKWSWFRTRDNWERKKKNKKIRKSTHMHPKIQVIGKHKSLNFRDERIKLKHQVFGPWKWIENFLTFVSLMISIANQFAIMQTHLQFISYYTTRESCFTGRKIPRQVSWWYTKSITFRTTVPPQHAKNSAVLRWLDSQGII